MPNLFFYAGTVFLRDTGIDPALPARSEARFARDHYLPPEMDWDVVRNTSMATVGQPTAAGRRTFELAPGVKGGSSPAETVLGMLSDSLFEQPSAVARPISNPVISSITKAPSAPAQVRIAPGQAKVGNSSGRVTKAEIDTLAQAIIAGLGSKRLRAEGLFSVGDCNSFHNAAYIFATVALHGRGAPVLVLNMDQHKDMGKAGQTVVASDTWGTSLLTQSPRAAAYLALGSGGRAGGNQLGWQFTPDGVAVTSSTGLAGRGMLPQVSAAQLCGGGAQAALAAVLQALQGQPAFVGGFQSLYITVDRDCMMRNWTQWKDLQAVFDDYQQVLSTLEAFMNALVAASPAVQLVGMDVTGLPEAGYGPLVDGTINPDTVSVRRFQYAHMQREIAAYHAFYTKWANRSAASTHSKWSSSGAGLRCSLCGKVHGHAWSSPLGRWHRCPTCERTYCSGCGYKLTASAAKRTKLCSGVDFNGGVCGATTELIS